MSVPTTIDANIDSKQTASDARIFRKATVSGELFEIESIYQVREYLGAGAYGVVCSAYDERNKRSVAIKKSRCIFQSRTLAKRTLREVRILRLLNHENIIKLKCVLMCKDAATFSEIYTVYELMETDLAQVIRSGQHLREQHVQFFAYQLLSGLHFLHSVNVLHRDIKPRNILVNSDCTLKITDFGLARLYTKESASKTVAMTEYVTTRWYRAPEVLVGWSAYTSSVDMWAVGCIIAELIDRKPIFPGADSFKQLDLICRCVGKFPDTLIEQARKPTHRQYLSDMPVNVQSNSLNKLYPRANPIALDLIQRLLEPNPKTRLSASDALHHSYLRQFTDIKPVPVLKPVYFPEHEFAFETQKCGIDDLKRELLREMDGGLPRVESSRSYGGHVRAVDSDDTAVASERSNAQIAATCETASVATTLVPPPASKEPKKDKAGAALAWKKSKAAAERKNLNIPTVHGSDEQPLSDSLMSSVGKLLCGFEEGKARAVSNSVTGPIATVPASVKAFAVRSAAITKRARGAEEIVVGKPTSHLRSSSVREKVDPASKPCSMM